MRILIPALVLLLFSCGCQREEEDTPQSHQSDLHKAVGSQKSEESRWGAEASGVRCKALVTKTPIRCSEPLEVRIELKNVSQQKVGILKYPMFEIEDIRFDVSFAGRSYVFEVNTENFDYAVQDLERVKSSLEWIDPGAVAVRLLKLDSGGLAIDPDSSDYRAYGFVGRSESLEPIATKDLFFARGGTYTVRVIYGARDRGVGNWKGTAVSRPVQVLVKE